jgi:chorismate mutase
MSSTLQPAVDKPDAGAGRPPTLADLRQELDRLDDALHDTLMRRAEVVAQVGALGVKGPVPLRPGREAAIIRRLLSRHRGAFPPASLVCLWRELICGMTALQRPLRIAVGGDAAASVAREHFGVLVPVHRATDEAVALRELRDGAAVAAVLPTPQQDEERPWWPALFDRAAPRIYVVARLPFWAPRPEGAAHVEAFVASVAAPDPSGTDRSLLGLAPRPAAGEARWRPELERAELQRAELERAGFDAGTIVTSGAQMLVDVAGFVADGDARLAALPGAVVLGAYAVPVGGAA